jgi:hypothetical protein
MPDPRTFWLSVANLVLGIVVLACVASVIFCIVHELVVRVQRYRAVSKELNLDMKRWFGSGHYPDVPHRRH